VRYKKDWSLTKKVGISAAILFPYVICITGVVWGWGTPSMTNYHPLTNNKDLKVEGYTSWNKSHIAVELNGKNIKEEDISDRKFEADGTLNEGNNKLTLKATNGDKVRASAYTITLDTKAPSLDLDNLATETDKDKVDIKGQAEKESVVKLFNDNKEITQMTVRNDTFGFNNSQLKEGDNKFKIVARDKAGNESSKEISIKYKPAQQEAKKEETKQITPQSVEQKITVPKYEIVYTLDKLRYDGGKNYYVLIDPVDISNEKFKDSIKVLIKKITSEKGAKIDVEIHDNLSSLNYSYEQYGTMTLTPNQSQKDLMAIHTIATFSGELKTMLYFNTLSFFPATSKDNQAVGKYVQTVEFNPNQFNY